MAGLDRGGGDTLAPADSGREREGMMRGLLLFIGACAVAAQLVAAALAWMELEAEGRA
jgi:hypothetical protein